MGWAGPRWSVQKVRRAPWAGQTGGVAPDVSQYFDTIASADFTESLARRIGDQKVLRLVEMNREDLKRTGPGSLHSRQEESPICTRYVQNR